MDRGPRSRAYTPPGEDQDDWPSPDDAALMFGTGELVDRAVSFPGRREPGLLSKLKTRSRPGTPQLARKRWIVPAAASAALALAGGLAYETLSGPASVELTVEVTPGDAQVRLDGRPLTGVGTQRRERVARGRHELVAQKPGFISERRAVTVDERATSYSAVVTLSAVQHSAALSVSSIPSGARILLDGQDTGKTTPAALADIPLGAHAVGLQLPGYADAAQQLRVPEDALVTVSLAAIGGEAPSPATKRARPVRELVRAPAAPAAPLTDALLQRRARVNAARAVCRQNGRTGEPPDADADAVLRAIGESCRSVAEAAANSRR